MSILRALCAAVASTSVLSALWFASAQLSSDAPATPVKPAAALAADETLDADELSPFKPVARVSSLMRGIGTAFGKLREVLPQTEDERRLEAIVGWSELIAELSNVNTRHRREPAYLAMAADTRSIALELARAARVDTPDEARFLSLVAQLDRSCSTCHDAQ